MRRSTMLCNRNCPFSFFKTCDIITISNRKAITFSVAIILPKTQGHGSGVDPGPIIMPKNKGKDDFNGSSKEQNTKGFYNDQQPHIEG